MTVKLITTVFSLALSACALSPSESLKTAFIRNMTDKHGYDQQQLHVLFDSYQPNQDIIGKMNKPAEALPWYRYRKIFLTETRIQDGVKFWREHADVLAAVEQHYGVPAEIIVAIIGVETQYGRFTGKYSVLDALATLAFDYPKRSAFFQSELEHYLLLCQEEHKNPTELTGSYAGAMGIPQFMPSSFNRYAKDYEQDGQRDIWRNPADAIASIANYFVQYGWQAGQGIAYPVSASDSRYKDVLTDDLKPDLRLSGLESLDLKISVPLAPDTKVKLIALTLEQGDELWLGLDNFYCLTRYNHSALYAMAVYQLSQRLLAAKQVDNKKGAFP